MLKRFTTVFLMLFLIVPVMVFAGGSSNNKCATKYPVVLAHGMGFSATILGTVDYWWGIGDALEDEGAEVFITAVNAMDSTENKAIAFKKQFNEALITSRSSKANIIAHSHGTLYSRFAISNLGLSSKVASLTSIAGPHKGSALPDLIMSLPDLFINIGGDILDFIYTYVFGDSDPNSVNNGYDVTTDYMINTFNPNTPDASGVYYQSWAAKAKTAAPSVVLEPSWLILLAYEGANDGLVSVDSAKWGNFRGVEDGAWYSPGCDHFNIVGQPFGITPGFNANEFYIDVVKDLKKRGY